jgi:hypothetical protein
MTNGTFHMWDFSSAQCGKLLAHMHRNSSLTLHFCVEKYLYGSITSMFSDVFTRKEIIVVMVHHPENPILLQAFH